MYSDYKVKPLHIMSPKTSDYVKSDYVKSYDWQTKWMYFSDWSDDLLEEDNTIWDKVNADTKKQFDSEPVHNNYFWKPK